MLAMPAPAKVLIEGLSGPLEANVRAALGIAALGKAATPAAIERGHRRARKQIREALQGFGYYRPEINAELNLDSDPWLARYQITPGSRTIIRTVDIQLEGPGARALSALREETGLVDQPLNHNDYRALKQKLLNRAFSAGYLDAELIQRRLEIDPAAATARIELTLFSGEAFYFGRVDVRQEILAPQMIDRYIHIREGDPFDPDALLRLQLRLSDLDYFQALEVETERSGDPPDHIDVTILTTPQKPQRYQLGLGFGTDTGVRFTANTEFRRLNRRGHRLRNDLRISEVRTGLNARYLIPAGRVPGAHWYLNLGFNEEVLGDTRSDEYQLGLGRERIQGPRHWQYYINYELESFRFADGRQETELLSPGLSLTLRRADDQLNPRRGYRLFADVHGALREFASSASFVQTLLQANAIVPLGSRSRMLLRGQLGSSFVGDVSELPVSQRFFAGGDRSIRGYSYRSLGPRNDAGEVIGGEFLSLASVEIDRLFWRNYGAALFFDYGGASDQFGELLQRSVGLGFRWRTAIGMLRVDVARPLDDPNTAVRLHIGIGAEL